MMDFFEALRERAKRTFTEEFASPTNYRHRIGIDATIEALKEIAVGEPLKGTIELEITQDSTKMEADETTLIRTQFTTKGGAEVWLNEHYGIDGEEVVVMVFKCEEVNQNLTKM